MKKIYSDYFQKSKVFLYPLLNIKKGVRFVPSQTYLSWNDNYDLDKSKFICLYKIDPELEEFTIFSDEILKKNNFFEEYHKIDEETHLYVFDFWPFKKELKKFINGQYSKLAGSTKNRITRFFGTIGTISEYVESYLYPENYYETYSNILKIPIEDILEVGELCDKPDLEKENFKKELVSVKLFK
tara:strand:- start:1676 stop:2230 length:555 start_codon:yes stop_codon:yes gene_type:complete